MDSNFGHCDYDHSSYIEYENGCANDQNADSCDCGHGLIRQWSEKSDLGVHPYCKKLNKSTRTLNIKVE